MTEHTGKIGLVEIIVRLVDMDEQLALNIIKARELKKEDLPRIYEMLRYNVFTMKQFAELAGLPGSTLEYHLRPKYNDNGKLETNLDYCFPFKSLNNDGPKCIVRNEKSLKYLGV